MPVEHESGHVELIEMDKTTDIANKVLDSIKGIANDGISMAEHVKEHAAKKDNRGIVSSIFDGIKSMTHKALGFLGHKDLEE